MPEPVVFDGGGYWKWGIKIGSSMEEEYKWDEAEFGDGYSQVSVRGLNHMSMVFQAQSEILRKEAQEVVAFLRSHSVGIPFHLVDPHEGVLWKVRVQKWKMTYVSDTWVRFDLEMKRVYNNP